MNTNKPVATAAEVKNKSTSANVEFEVRGDAKWSRDQWHTALWKGADDACRRLDIARPQWKGEAQWPLLHAESIQCARDGNEFVVHMCGDQRWDAWQWAAAQGLWTIQVQAWAQLGLEGRGLSQI